MSTFLKPLIKKAKIAVEQADCYTAKGNSLSVSFHAGELQSVERSNAEGLSLRIVKKGKTGLSSLSTSLGSKLSADLEDTLLQSAIETSVFGQSSKFKLKNSKVVERSLRNYDPSLLTVEPVEIVTAGRSVIKDLKRYKKGINVDVSFGLSEGSSTIANTKGFVGQRSSTSFGFYVGTNQIIGTEMVDIWEYDSSAHYIKDLSATIDRIKQKIAWSQKSVTVSTKKYPVIFTPKGFSDFFNASILGAIGGKAVLQKASPLSDKLGEKVLSSRFTLSEDPFIVGRSASRTFDDEGTPCSSKKIYDKGVLKTFIYDLQTAGEAGKTPTGNGSRGINSLPSTGFTSLSIVPGRENHSDLITSIEEGILIDQIMGAWAGNVMGGFVSGQIHLGFLIRNGKVVGRVRDAMVSGIVYELLSQKIELSKDRVWTHGGGGLLSPYILVPEVSISASK